MAASQEAGYNTYTPQNETIKVEYNHTAAIPNILPESNVPKTPQAIADRLRGRYYLIYHTFYLFFILLCIFFRLNAVKESYEGHEREMTRVRSELDRTELELAEHGEKAPLAAQRFRFYQELRGYVTDLVECLDEKVGLSFVHWGQQALSYDNFSK